MRRSHRVKKILTLTFRSKCGLYGDLKHLQSDNSRRKLCQRCWPQHDKLKEQLGTYCCQCKEQNCSCGHEVCDRCTVEHAQPIDGPIVDVITKMNRRGFKTGYSCCGWPYPNHTDKEVDLPYVTFNCDSDMAFDLVHNMKQWCLEYSPDRKSGFMWALRFRGYVHDKPREAWDELRKALDSHHYPLLPGALVVGYDEEVRVRA